ncbi:fatty acid desaturase [Brevibacillus sp. SYSU BS000544]|uniref:fatty acid desaturase n=1 Tax=Brevibacillus sp. SYSU BS000544 TaxID=3416443 RepID=UPI003CE487AB
MALLKEQVNWKKSIAPYEKSHINRSIWQLANTLIPFVALWYLAYLSLSVSYWLSLVFIIPAAGFLIRIFIIFHDCCHHSFFSNRKANAIVGTITGILTCCPYNQWRYSHNVHHATSGNLNKRGTGDIWTLTVDEYMSLSPMRRFAYQLYRNPFVMFVIGPIYIFLIDYRFNRKRAPKQERFNTYLTNLGIVGIAGLLSWTIGWQEFLMIQGPIFLLSGMAGVWLFYVQHQFENTYFEKEEEWDYVSAALEGSSFYNLPKILHWITGNIGFHHIHHLSPKVPNYNLPKAHKNTPFLQKVPSIGLLSSLRSLRYRVWSEQRKKFIGFGEIKDSQ